jgi:Zn-dependent protease/predicted transcriptional regulator
MKNSLNLGTFAGIKVQIHWTFWLLIAWIIVREIMLGNDLLSMVWSTTFVGVLFFCVVLHEYGHALTARRFGIGTESITLLPIGGIASLEDMPENPWQEFLVAIAGPAVNIAIAILLIPLVPIENYMNLSTEEMQQVLGTIKAGNFLFYLLSANIILVLFNIIPAFPMDGGRVFRALLSMRMNRVKATKIAAGTGQFLAMVFFFIGIFGNPILLLIGVFIFFGAQAESSMTEQMSLLHGYKVKDAMMTNITVVSPDDTLQKMIDILIDGTEKHFIVADQEGVKGVLYQDQLLRGVQTHSRDTSVQEMMAQNFETVQPDDDLDIILKKLRRGGRSYFPVVEKGDVKGSLDMENVNEFISVQTLPRN